VTRSLPRTARLALLPIGLAWALAAEWTRLAGGWSIPWVVADLVPGIAFLIAGEIAWKRRPDNRIGPLMVAIGFAWYVGTYGASRDPFVGPVAHAFQGYYDGLLAWLVLAYPTGRLRGFASRAVVGALLALLAVRTVFRLAMIRRSTDFDFADPAAVDRYIADLSLRDTGDALFRIGIAVLAAAVLVLVLRRLRDETGVGRRVAGPILLGGIAIAVGVIVEVVALAAAGSFAERSVAWDLGQALTVATAALVPIGFAFGLARSRLARGSVADLVVELGDAPERPALRDVLARALRDPTLEVAYAVPESGRWVDANGRDIELPSSEDPNRAMTRLHGGGRTVAVLVHDPALAEQRELVRSVAAAARLALENERLAAEVRTQLDEVRASRARIVVAGDAERRRVERDLHDGAQQRLVTLALALQVARGQVDGSNAELAASLDRSSRELDLALGELRELARGLHPTILVEEGLIAAVEALADRSPIGVSLRVDAPRCAPNVEAAAYFVVAEALTNVAKYAKASAASVRIDLAAGILTVEITDDGIGGADPARGSGLRGLDDRVAAAGGRLVVRSEPGAGTTIRAEIPCA
jgi:signal transduction histidine kinase